MQGESTYKSKANKLNFIERSYAKASMIKMKSPEIDTVKNFGSNSNILQTNENGLVSDFALSDLKRNFNLIGKKLKFLNALKPELEVINF